MAKEKPDKKPVHAQQVTFRLTTRTRADLRVEVLKQWIAEVPGTPEYRNTYRYDVEQLSNGSWIFAKRPAWKNKGIDFEVYCENFPMHGKASRPSHDDVISEIKSIISEKPNCEKELFGAIKRVWECIPPDEVMASLGVLKGYLRAERLLKILRWLFIEQDLTYWIESGRHMLRGKIENELSINLNDFS
ncbi:MAG: hypothetical protein ABSH11_11570 [Verrucomicrobiota bacterium]|jgi:hypothetical protein